ncbi:hypothetical protein ABPG72_016303 [Tetrahymena utriculariae]
MAYHIYKVSKQVFFTVFYEVFYQEKSHKNTIHFITRSLAKILLIQLTDSIIYYRFRTSLDYQTYSEATKRSSRVDVIIYPQLLYFNQEGKLFLPKQLQVHQTQVKKKKSSQCDKFDGQGKSGSTCNDGDTDCIYALKSLSICLDNCLAPNYNNFNKNIACTQSNFKSQNPKVQSFLNQMIECLQQQRKSSSPQRKTCGFLSIVQSEIHKHRVKMPDLKGQRLNIQLFLQGILQLIEIIQAESDQKIQIPFIPSSNQKIRTYASEIKKVQAVQLQCSQQRKIPLRTNQKDPAIINKQIYILQAVRKQCSISGSVLKISVKKSQSKMPINIIKLASTKQAIIVILLKLIHTLFFLSPFALPRVQNFVLNYSKQTNIYLISNYQKFMIVQEGTLQKNKMILENEVSPASYLSSFNGLFNCQACNQGDTDCITSLISVSKCFENCQNQTQMTKQRLQHVPNQFANPLIQKRNNFQMR